MNKKRWLLYILVLMFSIVSVNATTFLYENTTYTPSQSNTTYRIAFPVLQADNFTINDTCFIINGGPYDNKYCTISPVPTIINITASIPTINILYPTNGVRYNSSVSELQYLVTGDALDKCWYEILDTGFNSTTVSPGINFTGISYTEGSNTWKVWCNNTLNTKSSDSVTFEVAINPKLTLSLPTNTTYGNETVNYIIHSDENLSVCWFNYTGSTKNYLMNNVNGSTFNYSNSSMVTGFYETFFRCNDTFGYGNSSIKVNFSSDRTPPSFSNYVDMETDVFPERGELFKMNVTVYDVNIIDECKLYIYDAKLYNGTYIMNWSNTFNYSVNTNGSYVLQLNYSVSTMYPNQNLTIDWKVRCNDTYGNINYSQTQNFTIKDISTPQISLNPRNTFKADNSSVVTFSQRNLVLNISYNDTSLKDIWTNITCDISGQQFYINASMNATTYNYTNDTINFGAIPIQRCIVKTNASDWDGKSREKHYMFWVGGVINLGTNNIFDNSTFSNFSITILPKKFQNSVNGTYDIVGTTGLVENVTNMSYYLLFEDDCLFDYQINTTVTGLTQNLNYTSYESIINFRARNVKTYTFLENMTVNLSKRTNPMSYVRNSGTSTTLTFYANATTYNYTISVTPYSSKDNVITTSCKQTKTEVVNLNFNATFNLFDEKTLEAFNLTNLDSITLYLFCLNSTYVTPVLNTSVTIGVNCTYTKFRFDVEYLPTTEQYQRTFILFPGNDISQVFNLSIYLIDIKTTVYVKNNLILDDLLADYDNPSIYIYKNIPSGRVQVTADFIDITNGIIAHLIQNDEYIIEVHSDNQPLRVLGNYGATESGTKNIRLYDVNIPQTSTGVRNNLIYAMGTVNVSGTMKAFLRYEDYANTTTSVIYQVRQGSANGPILQTITVANNSDFLVDFNITNNLTSTLYGKIYYTYNNSGTIASDDGYKILYDGATKWENDFINKGYVSREFMNWFITLFLGMLAIFATIKSANALSLLLIGLGGLLITVGWYELSWGIIALAGMVALVNMLRQGEKKI